MKTPERKWNKIQEEATQLQQAKRTIMTMTRNERTNGS